jgi:hypothetical protein
MFSISTADARGLYTKALAAVYKERPKVYSFLRSFFPSKEYSTLMISIEVQRGTERIAADVYRGTEGNRNKFSLATEKNFIPPYFREYFDSTDLKMYERLFGKSAEISSSGFQEFVEEVADKMGMLQDKIERAYEKQCAEVFETGVVTLNAGTSIDFKRKAASIVAVSNVWSTGSNNPYTDLAAGGEFIRNYGKAQGGVFNVILGSSALSAFLSNTTVQGRNDLKNMTLDGISGPQRNATGATYHGFVTEGAYKFNLWSYPEIYETSAGVKTPYIETKKIVILPETPKFELSFAAVPQLITEGQTVTKGQFVFGDYKDERNHAHIFDVRSAGLPVPIAVDQIYTKTVLA